MVIQVVTASGAWLLVAAGIAKILRPQGAVSALRSLFGLAGSASWARLLGLVELALGVLFLFTPGLVLGAFLAGWFLALSLSAAAIRRSNTGCGCFGVAETRVTGVHVAVTLLLGAVSAAFALVAPAVGPRWGIAAIAFPVALVWYGILVPLATRLGRRRADPRAATRRGPSAS
jgi:hypothetical protein